MIAGLLGGAAFLATVAFGVTDKIGAAFRTFASRFDGVSGFASPDLGHSKLTQEADQCHHDQKEQCDTDHLGA